MNDKNPACESQNSIFEFHDCKDVIAHLGDFVDRELPLAQHAAVENHLNDCSDCAAFYASYKHVVTSAAELREPQQALPVDVANRLRKALNERLGINLPYIA
jgi:predicted anti-sigma-YlaC factor YlaD